MSKTAIIIGAGPAGLTAAHELLTRTTIVPIVLEMSEYMGGISRTVNYKGNRIDIGGHRFFSKSDRVMEWWLERLPMQKVEGAEVAISYQNKTRSLTATDDGLDPERDDKVMLVRSRRSRIYFMRKFFDYPLTLSAATIGNMGLAKTARVGISYLRSTLFPIRNEQNLEQFFINRFGRELYKTFFESYTEKVWGIPCRAISAEWGAQRIKGLSIGKAVGHFFKQRFSRQVDVAQKATETSLIEQFLYPKFGPGQMWEEVAQELRARGGQIFTSVKVDRIFIEQNRVVALEVVNLQTGTRERLSGDFFFSTMPIKDLVRAFEPSAPEPISAISEGLIYRDFITVGLLLDGLKIHDVTDNGAQLIRDNWIYIQEPDVQVGRIQIFNNWSPAMVADAGKVWVGLEYFCFDTDELWKRPDEQMIQLATEELVKLGMVDPGAVRDATVIHVEKTYPAYFGTYDRFDELRAYLDDIENLFLIGRNGMHRYNNQDHSMLTAMVAVDNILEDRTDKSNIWSVNTEQEYHEQRGEKS